MLPVVFMIQHNQRPLESLGATSRCALLACQRASIDAWVQPADAHYTAYQCVFGCRLHGKREKANKMAERRTADQHDMVSNFTPEPFQPYC